MWGKKKDAEHYIKIYCAYYDAQVRNREIALESITILGKMFDHAGEMPSSSGYMHDTLVGRIDKMRRIHPDYNQAARLLEVLNKKQTECCLSWGFLINRRPPQAEKVLRTVKDVAEYLDARQQEKNAQFDTGERITYDCYKRTRKAGIDRINAELGILVA